MKNILEVSLVILLFGSCKETVDPLLSQSENVWVFSGYEQLFSLNPQFVPVQDSLYTYQFEENGRFMKILGEFELVGSYVVNSELSTHGDTYVLEYDDNSLDLHQSNTEFPLIHTCFEGVEYMVLEEENTLKGSWGSCDGPTLYFSRGN
ncbi:hypothetical protein [Algoriphagus sp.]|uniref:hypothetical protein n=1 Tax=Algoriphagus sp. TaxID=1872435 RepID=UPI00262EE436|nr:hypothetical protein [Algoriphagus sp.]